MKPSSCHHHHAATEKREKALEVTPGTDNRDDEEITVSVEEKEATGREMVDNVEIQEAIEEDEVEETVVLKRPYQKLYP